MAMQVLSLVFCGMWVYAVIYMQRAAAGVPLLREMAIDTDPGDGDWPLLSVIIPACNEAGQIETALRSLLAQDYPGLELIVVNDRSTDATGEIIDRLAASDHRIRPVHVESLPDGWLGKVHALDAGVRQARGEWYLFTDADIHFEPDMLRRAIAYARHADVEHVTCLPEISGPMSFWLDVTIRSFALLFAVTTRLAAVNRNDSKWPVGLGAFNLVEASAFARTPGFEWLRMEPADDMGLGLMLKRAGARTRLVNGWGVLRVAWYASIGEMVRGLEKNSFGPGARYSYTRQLAMLLVLVLFAVVPGASLVAGILLSNAVLAAAGGIAALVSGVVALTMPRESARDAFAYLFLPVGVLVMAVIMWRATLLCFRNDGIDWRGTHYSVAELRAGQRVRF
jgi:hypothetical protein